MKERYCIIVPIYKVRLNETELASVIRTTEVFNNDIYFIAPDGLDCSYYEKSFPNVNFIFFSKKYFKSTQTYSKLLLTIDFYKKFERYKYMLIAQTDAMILGKREDLEKFIDMNYDYIGAPWFNGIKINIIPYSILNHLPKFIGKPKICYVANGGFCLRKIDSSIKLIKKHRIAAYLWANKANEDCFFSYFNYDEYHLAPIEIAEKFALEDRMKEYLLLNKIPFAVHAWEKFYNENLESIKEYISE